MPRALLLLLALIGALAPSPAHADDWKLVWSDEFSKDGRPDPANWDYERGFIRNNELQWYQPENAVCKGGLLIIEGRQEHKPNPTYKPGASGFEGREFIEVTSACLISLGKHEFTYGKFEMRARIDTQMGSWPAFWTLGVSRTGLGWPECGEVDIMESFRGLDLANVFYAVGGQKKASVRMKLIKQLGEDWATKFHVWTMEWDKDKIDLFVDGMLMNHFEVASDDEPGKDNAFRGPHYLLINQAIGGTGGGDTSKTKYPVRLEVDWVRVYQKAGAGYRVLGAGR